jgi:predicted O-methyltransferase YrrM
MDDARLRLLDELAERGREHDAREPDHTKRLLNLEPDTARLVGILVRSGRRSRLLEIGTSTGYSTIWLAWAARSAGGRVVSIERSVEKQTLADANLRRAGPREAVDVVLGDASAAVAGLAGPIDCVFFDADRLSAPAQLATLLPKLAPDVLLLVDNALSHPDEMAPYLDRIKGLPGFESMVVPIGKGLSVAYRVAGDRLPGAV